MLLDTSEQSDSNDSVQPQSSILSMEELIPVGLAARHLLPLSGIVKSKLWAATVLNWPLKSGVSLCPMCN